MSKEREHPRSKEMGVHCIKCQRRIDLEPNQKEAWCPSCGAGWGVRWLLPDLPTVVRRIITTP